MRAGHLIKISGWNQLVAFQIPVESGIKLRTEVRPLADLPPSHTSTWQRLRARTLDFARIPRCVPSPPR